MKVKDTNLSVDVVINFIFGSNFILFFVNFIIMRYGNHTQEQRIDKDKTEPQH